MSRSCSAIPSCWQAIDAARGLAEEGLIRRGEHTLTRWRSTMADIEAWVDDHGWDEKRGTSLIRKGGDEVDTSILLLALDMAISRETVHQ